MLVILFQLRVTHAINISEAPEYHCTVISNRPSNWEESQPWGTCCIYLVKPQIAEIGPMFRPLFSLVFPNWRTTRKQKFCQWKIHTENWQQWKKEIWNHSYVCGCVWWCANKINSFCVPHPFHTLHRLLHASRGA